MAITGISAISGEQIIAAGAVSAKEAGKASFTTGGNDIQNLYDTVSTNSASWAEGADYTAGNNISIAGNVISTTNNLKVDSITASGDVMVGNSGISTYVTAAGSNTSGSLWFNTQASLSDTYHIVFGMLNETAVEFGIRDENDWGENYWVSNLSTANLRNDFTITGLSSVPGAVTASAGSWTSLDDLISHGKIGVNTTQTSHYDCTLWKITGNLSASMSALNATVATNSAKWNTVTNKLDTTAFSTVSGNFLTAHQALPNSGNWDSTYTTVSTNSADWNSAAAMNELPVSAGEGMDIQNVDGTIVFSCTGGSVPEGVLVESGLEYNANNEISGYSGSAFAQPSISAAEWNSNYETVNTNSGAWGGDALPISAGPGVKVELTDGKLLFSTDETMLWSGTLTSGNSINLSETVKNFQYVDYYGYDSTRGKSVYYRQDTTHITGGETNMFNIAFADGNLDNHWFGWYFSQIKYDTTSYNSITNSGGNQIYANTETMAWTKNAGRYIILDKVIGINRTAGGN